MDVSETSVMLKKKRVLEVGGMFRRDAPFLELGCDPKTRMNPQLFENGPRNDARDFESLASAIPPHRRIAFERLLLYRILWVKSRGSFAPFLKSSRPAQNT